MRWVVCLALVSSSMTFGLVVASQAPAAADRAFSVRFSENIEGGQIRVAGNSWLTCSTTTGVGAASCTPAKNYQASGVNNSNDPTGGGRTMLPNDVDGVATTAYSSSSALTIPADGVVRWAGLYSVNFGPAGTVGLDTPATPGVSYVNVPSSQTDAIGPTRGTFADVTTLVRAGGSGVYTAAPSGFTPTTASGWVLMVVYGQAGGTDRQVVVNDGLLLRVPGGTTDVSFGGFRTPPSGNVRADVATVIYDPDAGYTDSVSLGNTASTQTRLPNPGPLANDYANGSVRNFGTKPVGAPNDANNFSVDAKVTQTTNLIGNNRTSAVAKFDTVGSEEYELPAVIAIAIDTYVAAADVNKSFVDENGGSVEPGDFLTYDLSVQSTGSEGVSLSTLTDPLPQGVTYVPGSTTLGAGNYDPGPVTDAAGDDVGEYDAASRSVRVRLGQGATATSGGALPPRPNSPTQTASFRVRVDTTVGVGAISNVARLTGTGTETGTGVNIPSPPASFTPLLAPALTLDKTATLNDPNGNGTADVGESVSYGFTVTNTGNTRLTAVGVTDPTLGTVTCAPTTLEPRATATCTAASRPVTQAAFDAGPLTNTATASGTTTTGGTVSDTDSTSTPVTARAPSVSIEKAATLNDADGDGLADAGESISYSFTVVNTGNVTLTGVGVTDARAGAVTCQVTTLAPTGRTTCTANAVRTVTEADLYAGSVDNSATASGTPPSGAAVSSAPDTTSTPTAAPAPSLRIDKFADWTDTDNDGAIDVGETIAYSFTVTNDGNVTISGVGVQDQLAGAVTCQATTLAPRGTTRCTAASPHVVTQAEVNAGQTVNTATASGTPPQGARVTSPPDSTTTPGVVTPAIEVVKTATVAPVADQGAVRAGDVITYGFTVTNRGNVSLTRVRVSDPSAGAVTCLAASLEPGQATTCTAASTRTVSQAEFDAGDPITNTASAAGTAPDGTEVTDGDSVSLPVAGASPKLEIVKTATPVDTDGDGLLEVGEQVTYSFTVTNTGDVGVANVEVDDALAGPVTCVPTTLAPRGVASCTADNPYVMTQDDVDAGRVDNSATATGAPVRGPTQVTSPPDTATVRVDAVPALELEKTASLADINSNGVADVDEVITYSFTVTNTGPLTLNAVSVADPAVGPVTCAPTTIGPTAASQCTATRTRTVTQAEVDAGAALTNTATATGTTRGGAVATGDDTAVVPIAVAAPRIELTKTATLADADGDGVADAGEVISYSFVVANTGNVTVTDPAVTDPSLLAPVVCPPGAVLPRGQVTCTTTATRTVTQDDVNAGVPLTNTATATATGPNGTEPTDQGTATTPIATAEPGLTIEKTATLNDADGDGLADLDETIAYGFVVTNTGNVSLTGVSVDDPTAGPVTCTPTTVAPTDVARCTAITPRVVTQADVNAGAVVNTASASGVSPAGATVPSAPDTATVRADVTPRVSIEKDAALNDANGNGVADRGETISYSFTVTNTGTTTLTGVGVTDALAGPVTCQVTTLAPKGTTSCTADAVHTVTEADVFAGSVDNSATASGTPPSGPAVTSDPDTTSTPTAAPSPSLRIDKFADWDDADVDTAVDVGEEISYSFRVLNDGNVTLNGVAVDDDRAGPVTCLATSLAPGGSTTCTADAPYVVTQDDVDAGTVVNTATAKATNPTGGPDIVSPPDSTTTPGAVTPAIEIIKSATVDPVADQGAVRAGDVITYGFTVFNRGNVTLRGILVDDPAVGAVTCAAASVAPGQSVACTAASTRTVSQAEFDAGTALTNTATVTGLAPDGSPVTDEDTVSLPLAAVSPRLEIAKTATPVDTDGDGSLEVGEQIAYSFTVTNTGDVTVASVGVDDALAGPVTCTPTSIAPTEDATCQADNPYVLTQDDVDAGRVDNTATANGAPVRGPTVTSPPDTATVRVAAVPALELEKTARLADTNGNGAADVDEVITYSFTVTNTGPLTLSGIAVDDPAVGPVTCAPTTIEPTAATECTAGRTRTVTQAEVDAGDALTNTATATGATRGGAVATDDDTAEVPVAAPNPELSLEKTATLGDTDGDGVADAGEVISYSFTVINSGNVTVTDPVVNDAALGGTVSCPPGALRPGSRVTCTTATTRTVTQAEIDAGDPLTNSATVNASGPRGTSLTGEDTATTPVSAAAPGIEVTKTGLLADGDGDGALDVGETITYTVRVENTGNVTLTDLEVADPVIGGVTCPVAELAPGVATTCTGDQVKTVTQTDVDAGRVDNTATAAAAPPSGPPVTGEDTIRTPAAPAPSIALDKTATLDDADGDGTADAGEAIAYGLTVTNTGNVTLTGIGVADPTLGTVTCPVTQLRPTEQTTCAAAVRTVTQAEVDAQAPLTNTATATGTAPQGGEVTDADTVTTPVAASDPGLSVTKASDLIGDDVLDRGDKVTYTFTARNTGNLTLTDLTTRDQMLREAGDDITCPITTLAPGQGTTCVATYEVTATDAAAGRVRNLATGRAVTPQGKVITSPTAANTLANPGSGAGTGGLPDTGGPQLMLVPLGLLAAMGGAYLLRRRHRDVATR